LAGGHGVADDFIAVEAAAVAAIELGHLVWIHDVTRWLRRGGGSRYCGLTPWTTPRSIAT
jgi:hypothetical protein